MVYSQSLDYLHIAAFYQILLVVFDIVGDTFPRHWIARREFHRCRSEAHHVKEPGDDRLDWNPQRWKDSIFVKHVQTTDAFTAFVTFHVNLFAKSYFCNQVKNSEISMGFR